MTDSLEQIEAELARLDAWREDLVLDLWADGRVNFRWSTGSWTLTGENALAELRSLPDGAGWQAVWSTLFDFH